MYGRGMIQQHTRGFSVVEVLLAVTIFGFLAAGVIGAIVYGRISVADAGDRTRASLLAEEGLEAARNMAAASFSNVTGTATAAGNTVVEAGVDSNANSTSAMRVSSGTASGAVNYLAAYIKTVDVANPNVQMAIYSDSSNAPGTRLAASGVQKATANSWNIFPVSGVTATANTNYWIGLSENGNTTFASLIGTGNPTAYDLTAGYPAPTSFSVNDATTDRMSFFMSIGGGTYGLAKSANQWTFAGASDTSGIYTRQVAVLPLGVNRKLVTSTVRWDKIGGSAQTSVATVLTNWRASIAVPTSWDNPLLAGSIDMSSTTRAVKVATAGDYAYVVRAATSGGLVSINMSNPAAPTIADTLNMPGTPTNIAISGNYAYVTTAANNAELVVVNISNPANLTQVGTYNASGSADGLAIFIRDSTAYLSRASNIYNDEIVVLSLANPVIPTRITGMPLFATMTDIYADEDGVIYATSTAFGQELMVFTPSGGTNYTRTNYDLPDFSGANAIAAKGSVLYIGQGSYVLVVDKATRVTLGAVAMGDVVNDVDVHPTEDYLFTGTGWSNGEFRIVSTANAASPTIAATVDLSGILTDVYGVAYNATHDVALLATDSDTQELMIFKKN